MANSAVKALGAVITILGLLFLLYTFYLGAVHGKIGEAGKVSTDAWLAILGWFLVLIGPALIAGETPVAIKQKLKR
ncbi:MAG: hypothetical protein GSR73_00850 [Desulfurococcales archaeon]|nr:hypothetical protein [Desulfurococcales archaeon]